MRPPADEICVIINLGIDFIVFIVIIIVARWYYYLGGEGICAGFFTLRKKFNTHIKKPYIHRHTEINYWGVDINAIILNLAEKNRKYK